MRKEWRGARRPHADTGAAVGGLSGRKDYYEGAYNNVNRVEECI